MDEHKVRYINIHGSFLVQNNKKNRTNERTLKMLNHCHLNWIQGTRLKKEDTFSYVQFFFLRPRSFICNVHFVQITNMDGMIHQRMHAHILNERVKQKIHTVRGLFSHTCKLFLYLYAPKILKEINIRLSFFSS